MGAYNTCLYWKERHWTGMEETKQGYPGGDCIVPVLTDEKTMGVH